METPENIVYTEAGKRRLQRLIQDIALQVEDALHERKSIPGEQSIEITGSDVEELARSMKVAFDRGASRRESLRALVVKVYIGGGILTALVGVFFEQFLTLADNPIQLALVIGGAFTALGGVVISEYLRTREREFRKRIEGNTKVDSALRSMEVPTFVALKDANLEGADLSRAWLPGASLHRINLRRAKLVAANLRKADLTEADLTDADLTDADLTDADLHVADLSGANLTRTKLKGTILIGARVSPEQLAAAIGHDPRLVSPKLR